MHTQLLYPGAVADDGTGTVLRDAAFILNNMILRLAGSAWRQPVLAVLDAPPVAPNHQQRWLIGANASGAFAGKAGQIAEWVATPADAPPVNAWSFEAPTPGALVIDIATASLLRWDGAVWTAFDVVGPEGPQGPEGAPGPQGAPGVQGASGPQGIPGAQGPKGDVGEQGSQGVSGAKGDTGEPGLAGAQGPAGPQGGPGVAGAQGPQGNPGPAGAKGDAGEQGAAGPQGAVGAEGPQGMPGPKGDPGETGLPGLPGAAGPQGEPGPKGDPGETGPQGSAGDPASVAGEAAKGIAVTVADDTATVALKTDALPSLAAEIAAGSAHLLAGKADGTPGQVTPAALLTDRTVVRPQLLDHVEGLYVDDAVTGSLALPTGHNAYRLHLTGDATVTLPDSRPAAADTWRGIAVIVDQDATGGRMLTIDPPAGQTLAWPGGIVPAFDSAANGRTRLVFSFIGGETRIDGIRTF